jgi:hypothetical protein
MKYFLLGFTIILLTGCLATRNFNPMQRPEPSVAPVTTKATASAVCTRCVGLTSDDLEELRWMLDEMPMVPPTYEYEEF